MLFRFLKKMRPFKTSLSQDEKGIAAIEFALVVPVIIILMFGSIDAVFALTAKRKVSLAAHSMADIAARATTLDANDTQAIGCIGRYLMISTNVQDSRTVLSGATVNAGGTTATINWTVDPFGNATLSRSVGQVIQLPATLNAGIFLTISETELSYDPVIGFSGFGLTGNQTIQMAETAYFQSRSGQAINGPAPSDSPNVTAAVRCDI